MAFESGSSPSPTTTRPRRSLRGRMSCALLLLGVAFAFAAAPLLVGPSLDAAEPAPFVPTALPVSTASLQQRFTTQIKPLLTKHCFACHGNGKKKGELSLDPYQTLASIQTGRITWAHIADTLKQKLMPPEDKPQP